MPEEAPTISFRVPAAVARALEEGGTARNQSRNEFARELLLEALSGPTNAQLHAELRETREGLTSLFARLLGFVEKTTRPVDAGQNGELRAEIHDLRSALATGVNCLLIQAAGVPPEEAQAWVLENMIHPRPPGG